jgi:hypothetical protein
VFGVRLAFRLGPTLGEEESHPLHHLARALARTGNDRLPEADLAAVADEAVDGGAVAGPTPAPLLRSSGTVPNASDLDGALQRVS